MTEPLHEPLPAAGRSADRLSDRPQAFYNALLTEHFVLESARGITVSESSTRASLYMLSLSSSLVAFGFLASTSYALGYLAIVIPVVFVLGLFTYERLIQTSLEDVAALASIQRIRRYYGTLLPEAADYFPAPVGAVPNEMLDIGQRGYRRGVFFTIPSAIGIVNSMVAGGGVSIIAITLAGSFELAALSGTLSAAILAVVLGWYQETRYKRLRRLLTATDSDARTDTAGFRDDMPDASIQPRFPPARAATAAGRPRRR